MTPIEKFLAESARMTESLRLVDDYNSDHVIVHAANTSEIKDEMIYVALRALDYYTRIYPERDGEEVYTRRAKDALAKINELAEKALG